ncbi:UbiA prenyltransferase family protein [Streptomyces formicae]|uniref:UbiA prenyltransferase family protein n=1 Tax=Streptomyces formicae TaxID=1616117 RepID=A0ABY3WK54_9ACTN|nr:UbiA prenyltransferase family protein [Streptomyces formicae]UNM12992.1 UbiA prenyltransferase family protein [Streptomyces formicae]
MRDARTARGTGVPAAADSGRDGTGIAGRLWDYTGLVRLECLPLLSAPFLLGSAVSPTGSPAMAYAWFAAGLALHGLSCASNDIADRELDALDPRRANRPLTSGRVPVRHAVVLSLLLGALFTLAVLTLPSEHPSLLWVSLALTVWGNTRQKRSRVPTPVSDLLWGVSVAAPLLAFTPAPTVGHLAAAAALALVVTAFDVAGGDVKDLETDLSAGLRTTAIVLGLRPGPHGVGTSTAFRLTMTAGYAVTGALCLTALLTASARLPLLLTSLTALLAGTAPLARHTAGRRVSAGGRSVLFLAGPFVAVLGATAALAPRPAQVALSMGAVTGATLAAALGRRLLARTARRLPSAYKELPEA